MTLDPDGAKPAGTDGTGLRRALRARIHSRGPLRFAEFMEAALYDERHGYYTSGRQPWGPEGDYLTAPQVHPALGRSIARLVIELDGLLERPDPLTVVEAGSGDGRLLAALCEALRSEAPDAWDRLAVTSLERSAWLRERQRAFRLRPPRGFIQAATIQDVPRARWRGAVYSNELLDAFPVDRVRVDHGRLEHAHVVDNDGRFELVWLPAADDRLAGYLHDNGIRLREGQIADISLSVAPWLEEVAARLDEGLVLTIDYGAETAALFGEARPAGSVVAQSRFVIDVDPLEDPGGRDITAHVDLGNLRRVGEAVGLQARPPCSLRVFLIGTGAAAAAAWPRGATAPTADRLRLRHLLVSEIGDAHRVVLQTRGRAGRLRFGLDRLGSEGS